jgi:hypothetical protein
VGVWAVSVAASRSQDDAKLLSPAREIPTLRAVLPLLSKPYPWPGQAYGAWQLVYGLQVFLSVVSILLPFKRIIHGSTLLSRTRFLLRILFVDGIVNFTRLCFVHAENVYQILNFGGVQAFEIGKA